MNADLRRVRISIFGETYTIRSDERDEFLAQAARLVDSLMRDLSARAQGVESRQLAMLVALHLALELRKAEDGLAATRECNLMLARRIDEELARFVPLS